MEHKKWVVQLWPSTSGHGMSNHPVKSGIKVTHIPSGMSEVCERFKSQHLNRNECIDKIKHRLED